MMKHLFLSMLCLLLFSVNVNAQKVRKAKAKSQVTILEKSTDVEKCLLKLNDRFYVVSMDDVSEIDSNLIDSFRLITPAEDEFQTMLKKTGLKAGDATVAVEIQLQKGAKLPEKYKKK